VKIAVKDSSQSPVILHAQEEAQNINQQRERVVEWPHSNTTNVKILYTEIPSKRFLPHLKASLHDCKDTEIRNSLLHLFFISRR
jgi:hypothetical protein